MWVVVEGGDGVGKTTLTKALSEHAAMKSRPLLVTREPGGSDEAQALRKLLISGDQPWSGETEVLMFTAARLAHLRQTVWPALRAGKTVLMDRYLWSTLAYQGARGVSFSWILNVSKMALVDSESRSSPYMPDAIIHLDMDPQKALERSRGGAKGEDRFEQLGLDFHTSVRNNFHRAKQRMSSSAQVLTLNVTDMTPDDVTEASVDWLQSIRFYQTRTPHRR